MPEVPTLLLRWQGARPPAGGLGLSGLPSLRPPDDAVAVAEGRGELARCKHTFADAPVEVGRQCATTDTGSRDRHPDGETQLPARSIDRSLEVGVVRDHDGEAECTDVTPAIIIPP